VREVLALTTVLTVIVAIVLQGYRYNITANHSRSLATSTRIPDLTDGVHTVRVKYDPKFDEKEVPHPSFQVSGFTTWFMNVRDLVVPLHCLWSDSGPRCEHLFSDAHLNASTPF
jgi:hypothetical protein